MRESKPPVFCDQCPLLALALLDGAPVCTECLAAALASEGIDALAGRVEPLRFKKPFWWRGWCQAAVVKARRPEREPGIERTG